MENVPQDYCPVFDQVDQQRMAFHMIIRERLKEIKGCAWNPVVLVTPHHMIQNKRLIERGEDIKQLKSQVEKKPEAPAAL